MHEDRIVVIVGNFQFRLDVWLLSLLCYIFFRLDVYTIETDRNEVNEINRTIMVSGYAYVKKTDATPSLRFQQPQRCILLLEMNESTNSQTYVHNRIKRFSVRVRVVMIWFDSIFPQTSCQFHSLTFYIYLILIYLFFLCCGFVLLHRHICDYVNMIEKSQLKSNERAN